MAGKLKFEPLYFQDRLTIINPYGSIGVVTLWSRVDYVIERFRQAGVDLDPATSPIAVFGNLYGNGLREMLRNLLYNPQIQVLLICGNNRSSSFEELNNFFGRGLEPVKGSPIKYKRPESGVDVTPCHIRGTKRVIDDLVSPEHFGNHPQIIWMGDPQQLTTIDFISDFFATWPLAPAAAWSRQQVTLPEVEVQYFPSNPRSQVVVRDTILEAWKEVLHLLSRFGRRVTLKKGERLELQQVKVVVEKPRFEPEDQLRAVNLDPDRLRRYQQNILQGEMRPDETYNYGHRLRTYFGLDTLAACAARLKKDSEDRKSYVTLWDNARDLGRVEGRPCLVSLYFRKFEGKLTLSATFRTHNAMDAYPMNLYGLQAILHSVAEEAGLTPCALVVISHSLGLDPKELDRALLIIGQRPFKVRLDPMGYFRITVDGKDILVEHRFEDVTLKEYRGHKAERLQHEIARDVALSDINHAIYLGRQLARAEMALKAGREFVQE
ncbi:MAG: thymidylate synthase [Deltaproteobacteria bacterium]|nr:thymidylate synthase [Deltaproteobacteria bacterium]